jgi:hypothetical protein
MTFFRTLARGPARATAVKLGSFFVLIPITLAVNVMIPFAGYAVQQGQAQPQAAKPARSSTQITLRDVIEPRLIAKERMSWQLAINRDATSYKALHAPDFFTLSGTGITDRALSESSALDSNVHFDQCNLSGFSVRFVGENAALITYHVKAAGLDHGKAFQLDSYASSLWMKRDGKWLNVFYQATPAAA